MARSVEEHDELLAELLVPDLEQARKTEILQELRTDFREERQTAEELAATNAKLKSNNDDLVISNSKLFRQAGIVGGGEPPEEKKKQALSETITIEELEKRANL